MGDTLQTPPLPVRRVDEAVGFGVVGYFHFSGVPLEFLAEVADGYVAQEGDFGEGAAVVEVGTGGDGAFAGEDPVPVVALGTGDGLFRSFVGFHLALGENAAAGSAVGTVGNDAVLAVDDGAFAGQAALAVPEFLGDGGLGGAVVPDDFDGGSGVFRGKSVLDFRRFGEGVAVLAGVVVFGRGHGRHGGVEVEGPEDGVEDVAGPVAGNARAEGAPAAPFAWVVVGVVGATGRGTEPEVPVQGRGDGDAFLDAFEPVDPAVVAVAKAVDFADGADGSVLDPFAQKTDMLGGVALVAELGGHAVLAGGEGKGADFVDRVGQGLFAVDVLASPHGGHGDDGVGVVWGGDGDGVDFGVHLVEHFAVILVLFGFGMLTKGLGAPVGVHVAEGDYVFAFQTGEVPGASAVDADKGYIEFFVGRNFTGTRDMGGDDVESAASGGESGRRSGRGGGDELASGDLVVFYIHFLPLMMLSHYLRLLDFEIAYRRIGAKKPLVTRAGSPCYGHGLEAHATSRRSRCCGRPAGCRGLGV